MIHRPDAASPPPESAAALRRFGLTMALLVAGLLSLLPSLVRHRSLGAGPRWPLYLATALAAGALGAPSLLGPVRRGWMGLGRALGWVNTRLLLTAVFFLVVTPMGLLGRLVGRRPLRHARETGPSYRVPSVAPAAGHMKEPF